MPTLDDFTQYSGAHWETGTLHNILAYKGITAPHSGQPISEAMLLGISGGITFAYFSFAYAGHDPHVALLPRNTFDPMTTILDRLGIVRDEIKTGSADKAQAQLIDLLEGGEPVLVWADMYSLPYNALPGDIEMWGMAPVVVYGLDADADRVLLADRAAVPLQVSTGTLSAARGRVKKDRFRMMTLDLPSTDKLAAAVTMGLWDCVKLYLEGPPGKIPKANFGLNGFAHWAKLLTTPKEKQSWAKVFPPGREMISGLMSAYGDVHNPNGLRGGDAERGLFAGFLDEAALLLDRPGLRDAAEGFRASGAAWRAFGAALLPESVAPLGEIRALIDRKRDLFCTQGGDALPDIHALNAQIETLKTAAAADFPLDDAGVTAMHADLAERLLHLRDLEAAAVESLRAALG